MSDDRASQLGAVTREVANRDHQGKPARAVIAIRAYDTTIDDVWDALTSAERIPRWFLPISGDLRLGGRYQLQGNAGGEITTCEPPRRLAMTWEFGGSVSWVTVQLTPDPAGGARLELQHLVHVDDHWNQFGPGAVGVGWDLAIMGLARHLATGAAVDQAESMAWFTSADGKHFVTRSSEDWLSAAIAGGAPETEATEQAARTTAAYTGG